MRGLIYKDLYLQKWKILVMGGMLAFWILIAFCLTFIVPGLNEVGEQGTAVYITYALFAVFVAIECFVFAATIQNSLLFQDEDQKWKRYAIALPESVRGVVAAKYTTMFIVSFCSFVVCVAFDALFSFRIGASAERWMIYLCIVFYQLFMRGIELPLAFRFGAKHAAAARTLMVVIFVLVIAVYAFFGDISWIMEEGGVAEKLGKVLSALNNESASEYIKTLSLKILIVYAMIPHLIVAWYYVSFRISCKVYLKGVADDN